MKQDYTNLINQAHKQALKQKLLMEYAVLHIEQAQRSSNSSIFNILKIMAQKLHWKLSIPIISTGLVAAVLFTVYNPSKPNNFLDSVKVAYAKEAEQMNNADLVHHTKIIIKQTSKRNVTAEHWDSKEKSTILSTDNSNGKNIGHAVMLYDETKNDPFKQTDNLPLATYDLPANIPDFLDSPAESIESVTCFSGIGNDSQWQPANLVMADISQLPKIERIQKIQELMNNNQVEDLGDKDGVHGFKANMEEYYFDSTTFKLKKHLVYNIVLGGAIDTTKPPIVEEYIIDEYIPKDQVDAKIWSTENLKLVPDGLTPAVRKAVQANTSKEPTCYNEKGEKVNNGDTINEIPQIEMVPEAGNSVTVTATATMEDVK